MSRVIGIVGLLFAVVLTVGACGGSGGEESGSGGSAPGTTQPAATTGTAEKTTATETAKTLPEPGETLSPGEYVTTEFEPAFSFRVGEGWQSAIPESQELVGIARGDVPLLSFVNPSQVFDSKQPAEQKKIAAPDTVDGWVAWYQQNPYLEVSDPEPAAIGDATGVSLSLRATSAPEDYGEFCDDPCVPGYPVGDTAWDFYLGDKEKDYVLEVGGDTVIVSITSPSDRFKEFVPKAQDVLDTVEWKALP